MSAHILIPYIMNPIWHFMIYNNNHITLRPDKSLESHYSLSAGEGYTPTIKVFMLVFVITFFKNYFNNLAEEGLPLSPSPTPHPPTHPYKYSTSLSHMHCAWFTFFKIFQTLVTLDCRNSIKISIFQDRLLFLVYHPRILDVISISCFSSFFITFNIYYWFIADYTTTATSSIR